MRTEARRAFRYGFVLTEQELRRIVDSMTQHVKRITGDVSPRLFFEIKFRNGAIAEPSSLEEVLEQENIGSSSLVRLKIKIQDKDSSPCHAVSTEFVNTEEEEEERGVSVRYSIIGESRDWVFVTSSELEERLNRVKRFNLSRLRGETAAFFFFGVFMLGFLLMIVMPDVGGSRQDLILLEELRNRRSGDQITDLIEILLAIEESKIRRRDPLIFVKVLGLVVVSLILFFILTVALKYLYPPYNFCWGEYLSVFERRQNIGKFIFVGIILAIVISIVAEVIGRRIGVIP